MHALPEETREPDKASGSFHDDRDETIQLGQQINIFIEDHKVFHTVKIVPFTRAWRDLVLRNAPNSFRSGRYLIC